VKTLFDPATANEMRGRLQQLRADNPRQWGKMTPAQAIAHCASVMEWATGEQKPPRMLLGRVIAPFIRRKVIYGEEPMRRNAPTDKRLIIADERDIAAERQRLIALIERFSSGGPGKCTTHPHSFFGRLTPQEWARLMYKHIDHHLRQFGA